MKGFNFKLEKVLKVRSLEEDLARNRLMQANKKAREIKEELTEMNSTQEALYQVLRTADSLSLEETVIARSYLHHHREKINQTEEKLVSQQEVVARRQEEMISRQKKRKVLEKLKEKEYQRFYKEFLHKEQKELDEIGLRSESKQGG